MASSESTTVFITEYNVSYSDPTTGTIVDSTTVSTCGEDICETDIIPPSSIQVLSSSTITVTADDGFGQRLISDPITIGIILVLV